MKDKIRVLIVDDEPVARKGLELLIAKDTDVELVGAAGEGKEAVTLIKKILPDLLFLDIQMPGMDGFEVLDELFPAEMPIVVFVTAYDQYAIRAFEANAIDYLLKPFDDERFFSTLQKAKDFYKLKQTQQINEKMIYLLDEISASKLSDKSKTKEYVKRIPIKDVKEIKFVEIDDIEFIESADYCSIIHARNKQYTIRETMKHFEEKLDPEFFVRIHRKTIINIKQIASIQLYGKDSYMVITHSGDKFDISRSRLEPLKKQLGL